MTEKRCRLRLTFGLLICLGFASPQAHALSHAYEVGDCTVTVFAPDWTWQKRDINILVIARNKGQSDSQLSLELRMPQGQEDHFSFDGELNASFEVSAGGEKRYAFTGITALDGVPRQQYSFTIVVSDGARSLEIPYAVRTIRGAAVNPGLWAVILPAVMAAAWCLVFLVIMRRFASPGAWKTPGPPIEEPEELEPWIRANP